MKVRIGSGGRFHIFDLARQMERLGHLTRLYTGYPKWKVDGISLEKVDSFPWLIVPVMMLPQWGADGLQKRLNHLIKETFDGWLASRLAPCDVFHSLSGWASRSHRVAKERYGALTVCDRGSSHILFQDDLLAAEYARWGVPYRPIDRRVVERELQDYRECDLIFVPSTFARRSFLEKGVPQAKLFTIPYGVDLRLFQPIPKQDDVFRVIYVGAMSLRKGIPYLLEAIASLQLAGLELWLIGGGLPEAQPFLAKYDGCYRYFGVIPRAELHRYYSQGSVFVLASIEEGLALVQAQAMACGLPVIATANTGAEDLFTDGVEGFIVPIRDPEAIQEKVIYLYEHPEVRDQMGRAALRRARALGGWNRYGDQVADIYEAGLHSRN